MQFLIKLSIFLSVIPKALDLVSVSSEPESYKFQHLSSGSKHLALAHSFWKFWCREHYQDTDEDIHDGQDFPDKPC